MTDWKDDLKHLLTDVNPHPVEDILSSAVAQPVLGALSSAPVQAFSRVANVPLDVVKFGTGGVIGGINRGLGMLDEAGVPGAGFAFEPGTEEAFSAGGPMAAWNEVRADEPLAFQAITELGLDPINYLGIGAVGKAGRAAIEVGEAATRGGRPLLGAGLSTAGRGAVKTQDIYSGTGRKILEGVALPRAIPAIGGRTVGIQPAFRQAGRGLERIKPGILETSTASRIREIETAVNEADRELDAVGRYTPSEPDPRSAIEQPLFHGSTQEGLRELSADLPLGERGNPNAASTLGVFTTPHRYAADDYAKGALDARVPDPVSGEVSTGFVYTADVPELQNPIFMDLHDFYGDFVRTDTEAMEKAAQFKTDSMAAGHDGIMVVREGAMAGKTPAQLSPDDIREVIHFQNVPVRPAHWNPLLTAETNELYDTPVPTKAGEAPSTQTYGQFLDEAEVARQADIDTIKAAGFDWKPGLKTSEVLKIVADDPQVTKIVKTWAKDLQRDPLHTDSARGVARLDLVDTLEKAEGITHTRSTVPSLLVAAWKSSVLATPRFVAQNLQSNMMMQMVKGVRPTANWREYVGAFQADRHGKIIVTADEAMESSGVTQFARKEGGQTYAPQELFRGGSRGFAGTDRYTANPVGELVGRVTRSQKLATLATHMVEPFEHAAMAVDSVARGGTWQQKTDDALRRLKPEYDARVAAKLAEIGITDEVFSTAKGIGLPEEGMFPQLLKQRFVDLGLSDGNATHLTRAWGKTWKDASREGMVETNKIMFDYSRTNLDDMVGKLVPFHYWPSRSLRFWGEESLRNPAIPLNYMRMRDGLEDAQENPGMSARQKGFLHVMGTSLGFSLLMNPDALFGFSRMINIDGAFNEPEMEIDPLTGEERPKDTSFVPQGETELGHVLRWLKEKGIGLYPWFDSAFNVMGTYGNTFEPDFLPVRYKALAGAAINEFRAHVGWDPVGAPYADAMGQLRQGVSTATSAFLPDGMQGWLAEPVTQRGGKSSQEANLDTIIEHEILSRNPGLTNGQLLEIMSDPSSAEYERAYATVSDAGLVNELLGIVVPFSLKLRHDARDVTRAQVEVISDEADRRDVLPWELAPTIDDVAFKARYKRLTGKDYTPGDYETAKLRHDLSRAPLEAKPYLLAEAEFNVLGTDKERGHYAAYYALLLGDDPAVAGLSDAGRQALANRYIETHPHAQRAIDNVRAIRDEYIATHPEFAEFKAWQDRMDDLRDQYGDLTEYRRQASAANPNAARYFQEQLAYIQGDEPNVDEQNKRFEQSTRNMGAFLAITGKAKLRSVPGPFPGVPPVDLTLPNMTAVEPSYQATGNDWSRQLASIGMPGVRQRI